VFTKVLSRLATLHEAVRRPAAALTFLQQLQAGNGSAAAGGAATLRRRMADLRISEARGGTQHHFRMLHLPITAKVPLPDVPPCVHQSYGIRLAVSYAPPFGVHVPYAHALHLRLRAYSLV